MTTPVTVHTEDVSTQGIARQWVLIDSRSPMMHPRPVEQLEFCSVEGLTRLAELAMLIRSVFTPVLLCFASRLSLASPSLSLSFLRPSSLRLPFLLFSSPSFLFSTSFLSSYPLLTLDRHSFLPPQQCRQDSCARYYDGVLSTCSCSSQSSPTCW